MKNKVLLILSVIFVLAKLAHAQSSTTNSISDIKQQKRMLDIAQRVEERKQKLVKLEKELGEKNGEKDKAIRQSEESAIENREAAIKLSDDAQDRKKAKRAEKRSDQAKRDAKKARGAASNAKELEKDILQLRKKIAEDEETLSKLNAQTAKQ